MSGKKRRSGVFRINPTRRDVFAFAALGLAAGVMVRVRFVPPVLPPNVRPPFGITPVLSDVALSVRPERAESVSLTITLTVEEVSSPIVRELAPRASTGLM